MQMFLLFLQKHWFSSVLRLKQLLRFLEMQLLVCAVLHGEVGHYNLRGEVFVFVFFENKKRKHFLFSRNTFSKHFLSIFVLTLFIQSKIIYCYLKGIKPTAKLVQEMERNNNKVLCMRKKIFTQ